MRILHVGSGLRAWRRGGLVAYVEDLMDEQIRRGHAVAYFFSGRYYPWHRRPRLRRWQRGPIPMYEVVTSPLFDHGRQPLMELEEPQLEAMLTEAIERTRCEVVHVHELAGLPSSLLEVARRAGVPVVMTLQDYFLLCPTFKLLDSEGRVCLRREIGADCVATTASDPRDPGIMFHATIRYELGRFPLVRLLPRPVREALIERSAQFGAGHTRLRGDREPEAARIDPAEQFQRRRDRNVERLSNADRLVAMSSRVGEIYEQLGVGRERLSTVELTLAHVEKLRPRPARREGPVTFGTLAAFESAAKGGELLIEAVRRLSMITDRPFRVLVFGTIDPVFPDRAAELPALELHGRYRADQLDALLDEVDVGLMLSVWEEAYGYAGVEFLAKGIPVLANAIGGMVDYTREGETGWLNRSLTAQELASIMRGIVERPDELDEISAKVRSARDSLVKPMARHAAEMDEIYRELIPPPRIAQASTQ